MRRLDRREGRARFCAGAGPLAMILEHACITWSLDGDTLAAAIALLHHSAIYRRERAITHTNTGGITQRRRRPVRATAVRAGPKPPRERRKRPWKIRAWAPRIKSQALTASDAMLSRQTCSSHAALPSQQTAHPRHWRPAPPTAHAARGTSKGDEFFRSEMHGDNMRSQNYRCDASRDRFQDMYAPPWSSHDTRHAAVMSV